MGDEVHVAAVVAAAKNTDTPTAQVTSNMDASNVALTQETSYAVPDEAFFINVGGDIFAMKDGVPPISLLYQDYATFQRTFTIPPYPTNVVQLLNTYMRWHGWDNTSFTFKNVDDKNALLDVLHIRIKQIPEEIDAYGKAKPAEKDALFLSHKRRVMARLQDIVDAIKTPSTSLEVKLIPDPREQYLLLLEVAWQLSQPSMSSTWTYHLDAIHRLRLRELPEAIRAIQDQPIVQPRNVFEKIPAPSNAVVQGNPALQNRIRALLMILHMQKATETGETIRTQATHRGGSQEKDGQMDHLFRHAMLPLFDHFRVMFDPIYSMLESHHRMSTLSTSRLFSSLSSLFYMCHHLHRRSSDRHVDCIYRIHHLPIHVLSFFQEQLRGTRTYVKGLTSSKKREFVQQLSHLPAVRLSSLKAGHTSFQFYLLNENMTLPTAQQWVDPTYSNRTTAIHESLSEFFTDRHLYIVCGGADHVPLRIRDVDGRSLRKNDVRVDPLYSHRLNRTPLFLDEVFTFDPYVLYLDTELVLSMLLVSKDQLSS
jgi:hypothetical protein